MSVPGIVQETLGEEQIAAEVGLGGEDQLFVTPRRTLIYRGEGLLSDESVEEYPHDAERIEVKQGRRKSTITLEYGIDGPRSFSVPSKRLDDALHPVVAGVLNAAGVTEPGETVKHTYRFSELTLIITSDRLVKHIGQAVWDPEYEQYHFGDATGLTFEEGSVATQIVLEIDGRQQRVKASNDQIPQLREHLEEALFSYHGAANRDEFEAMMAPEDEPEDVGAETGDPDESSDGPSDGSATPEASEEATLGGLDPLDPGRDLTDRDAPTQSDTSATTGGTGQSTGSGQVAAAEVEEADTGSTPDGGAAGTADDGSAETADDGSAETADAEGTHPQTETSTTQSAVAPDDDLETAGFEAAEPTMDQAVAEELDRLTEAVERQNQLLSQHHATIQQLIEELRKER